MAPRTTPFSGIRYPNDTTPAGGNPREGHKREKEKGNKQKGPSGNPHGIRPEGKKDRRNIKNGVPGAKARREPHHKWKRRRATLPHPLECSTIAAPGLSYRVRNGTGRLTRAMTTANLTATAGKPKESKPANQSFVAVREPASGREAQSPSESNRDHQALIVAWDRSTGKTRNQPMKGSECCVAIAR